MAKFVLHAGRHKSGTTAIQQFLSANPGLLQEHGYYYPKQGIRGYGHHEIASLLTRAAVREAGEELETLWKPGMDALQKEISSLDSTILISSEALQNANPADVKRFFGEQDYKIVFYIREQVSYLVSAYAQKIHATRYAGSLDDFYHNDFVLKDYDSFLHEWIRVYGEAVVVRVYEKSELLESNVVYDFCHRLLGMDLEKLQELFTPGKANPSLTRNLLAFKRAINVNPAFTEQHQRDMYIGLAELALHDQSGPVSISSSLAQKVADRYRESNDEVARKFFDREALFQKRVIAYGSGSTATAADLEQIANQLVSIRPGLRKLLSLANRVA